MMTISTQEAGKPRKNDSILSIGKGVLSTPKLPNRLYEPSGACQGVEEDHSVAVKRLGRDTIFCCPF